jgi:hypothetical protein
MVNIFSKLMSVFKFSKVTAMANENVSISFKWHPVLQLVFQDVTSYSPKTEVQLDGNCHLHIRNMGQRQHVPAPKYWYL